MKSGITTPLVIVIVIILIALAIGGFLIVQQKHPKQLTDLKNQLIENPLVGIWKPVKSYFWDEASSQWFELKPTAEEKAKAEKEYIRFTNINMCVGEFLETEFRCTQEEQKYWISGNFIETVEKTATPSRTKWSVQGNILELITEWSPAGEWVPSVKLTLTK